jgi:hypothetical protein
VLPAGGYEPDAEVHTGGGSVVVDFLGEDGRRARYEISDLPLEGWHLPLARALATRVGPAGGLRTRASADSTWDVLGRFIRFLDRSPGAPRVPGALTGAQVRAFVDDELSHRNGAYVWGDLRLVGQVMELQPLAGLLGRDALEALSRRKWAARPVSVPGYSDGELSRLVTAARAGVAAIRDRLAAGQVLLESFAADPGSFSGPDLARAQMLTRMAATGLIPPS